MKGSPKSYSPFWFTSENGSALGMRISGVFEISNMVSAMGTVFARETKIEAPPPMVPLPLWTMKYWSTPCI